MDPRAVLLNRVANRPEILSVVAPGSWAVELSGFFKEPRNVMLGDDRGLILFAYFADLGDGPIYEGHYLLTGALRGRAALIACRAALRCMFTTKNAAVLFGLTPVENKAARAVNAALGFRRVAIAMDAHGRDCHRYMLDRATWAALQH